MKLKSGLSDDSSKVQRYCTEALAKITGQWGWRDGLLYDGNPLALTHGLDHIACRCTCHITDGYDGPAIRGSSW